MRPFRLALRWFLAVLFVGAGVMHFTKPRGFVRIVPDQLPNPELLVGISGVAEVLGGIGLLLPQTRKPAAVGLVALLVAVFPANINMALHADTLARGLHPALVWARLPLQPLLVAAVIVAAGGLRGTQPALGPRVAARFGR